MAPTENRPRVTIAIPTYNRMDYLDQALQSAVNQNYEEMEILVGDSSQHDGIEKKIEAAGAGSIRYIRYDSATKQSRKFNELLSQARGEWMVFLGDDDLFGPEYLSALMARIERHPDASLARCRKQVIDENGKHIWTEPSSKPVMSAGEFLYRLSLPEKQFFKMNITGILFRRDLLIQAGGFLETLGGWHLDHLTWAMLGARGLCLFEERPLCSIRVHSRSLTSDFERNIDGLLQANLTVKRVMEDLIYEVTQQAGSEEEKHYIGLAEQSLEGYLKRHMTRSLDHGFVSELEADEPALDQRLKQLSEKMRIFRIPAFRSYYFYQCLKWMPYPVRKSLLSSLKTYKVRKQCMAGRPLLVGLQSLRAAPKKH